jgi:asparagine synthase (glutamine-hydrolysing)
MTFQQNLKNVSFKTLFMRICGGKNVEKMSSLMGISPTYARDDLACSKPEGVTEGLVCDSDIYGVRHPAAYLKDYIENHSHNCNPLGVIKEILQNIKGGYACAWKNKGKIYIFRDPVGLKPLYYMEEAFASEKKAFGQRKSRILLPGQIVRLPGTVVYRHRICETAAANPQEIVDALRKSAHRQIEKNAAVLFSGGIDSCILASLSDTPLITCGLENSQDIQFSRKASTLLKRDLREIVLSEREIENAIPEVLSIIEDKTLMNLEIGLLIFFVCQEWDGDILISGNGADELFGGYFKYEKAFRDKKDVKVLMRKDFDLIHHALERDCQIAERFEKKMRYPYLDCDVVKKALSIPAELLFDPQRKEFLRKVARLLSLPEEIATRPKKALQYGSNIHKTVKKSNIVNQFRIEHKTDVP